MKSKRSASEAATDKRQLAENSIQVEPFGDKGDVAALVGLSRRWVETQLPLGLPHIRLGNRRTKFDLAEVRSWLKDKYGS